VLLSDWLLAFADRHRWKLFLALLGLYALGFNAQWRVEPDSALYLSVGRNLAEGRGYTFNGEPHRLVFPGLPLLFAGIFKLFPGDAPNRALVAALVVMLLIGAAVLALTYRLFLLHVGRPTAVMITFGLGISRLFYFFCFELRSDMPFLLGVMAFLVGHEAVFHRRPLRLSPSHSPTSVAFDIMYGAEATPWRLTRSDPPTSASWFDYVLLIGGLGAAVATRPTMWALLMAIALALGWSLIRNPIRLPQIMICAAMALLGAGAFAWRFHTVDSTMGQYEESLFHFQFGHMGAVLHNLVHENIPRLFQPTLSQALFGSRLDPFTGVLTGSATLVVSATMLLKRPLWFLWVAMTVAMMLVAIKPLDRYFLECLPLLVFAWWSAIRWLNQRLPQPWANWVFIALFLFGGITNLCRTTEFIVEQRRKPFLDHYKEGRYASQQQVGRLLQDHVDEKAWVVVSAQYSRSLAFLSRRKVVGPRSIGDLRLPKNNFYALEPLDEGARRWFEDIVKFQPGPEVGSFKGKMDAKPWQLYKAVPKAGQKR
jgi:hypothetical protein